MEKFTNIFAPVFGGALLLFMFICGNYRGPWIFDNYYSQACERARKKSIIWPILGNVLFAVPFVAGYMGATDRVEVSLGLIIFGMFAPLGFAFSSFGGFDFTIEGEE
jgi:hypothetical protein